MWKLILIILTISLFASTQKEDSIYIIVDDCKNWRIRTYGNLSDQFFLSKERKNKLIISLGHGWIEPSAKLTTEKLTFPQILNKEPIYTSTLNDEGWYKLIQVPNRKFYILRYDDFCSERRFLYGFTFVLYEVKIHMDGEE
jgi:hypothetical protein